MKEIENKIKDSIFGEFNKELIGDKVTLQNKVNKLQRMIDMINYLQPVEDTEVDCFVLPEKWCIKRTTETDVVITDYFRKLHNFKYSYNNPSKFIYTDESNNGFSNMSKPDGYTEITFEQFKKYVLNK